MDNVLAILLAGGAGERLFPLTRNTAKPAVPFGGIYRIIDFTLSNCVNSGLRQILCLTQYKSLELGRHLREGWNLFAGEMGEYIEVIPPMKRIHSGWYLGTADAVYQNLESVTADRPEYVLILAGDQIYKMDYREMFARHSAHRADVTVATLQVPREEAFRFGVMRIEDQTHRITGFAEKPENGLLPGAPHDATMVNASMGIYVFTTKVLLEALHEDAACAGSSHDFGRDILPRLIPQRRVLAYDFRDLNRKKVRYWRDIGTIDAYFEANMDLVSVTPEFNLYDQHWPIRTRMPQAPPAKFVFAQEGRRMGVATDSIVAPGVIVSGARVHRSVLSPGVRVNSYCDVQESILLNGVNIGRYCRVRRAILDVGVNLPEGTIVGEDSERDRAAGWHVTEGGVTVVSGVGSG
ncbi:MAG: glucose-1-phosphate adenylyltransferase [Candidatus Solibacter usitatus]|nr:glucose-1-phosphate adenylyltransferase [Candidatus Solibacter usitatus]